MDHADGSIWVTTEGVECHGVGVFSVSHLWKEKRCEGGKEMGYKGKEEGSMRKGRRWGGRLWGDKGDGDYNE